MSLMQNSSQLDDLLARDRRYRRESYALVSDALNYAQYGLGLGHPAQNQHKDDSGAAVVTTHVTGQDLCFAVKDYALHQFGYMAPVVLKYLGIHQTSDIGAIVYNLSEIGIFTVADEDRREDFDDVFDMQQELEKGFVLGK